MADTFPLHQRLTEEFRARIDSGAWAEGQRAPSEAALRAEFGTSRGPIRQALAALRAEGLIVGGQGRSPVVRRNVARHATSALGSFTAWALGEGREPDQRTLEQSRHPADAELADRLQIGVGDPVVTVRRVRYLDGRPALLENLHFTWTLGRALMEFDPDSGSINAYLLDRGADLYSSTHRIDAVSATDAAAAELGVAPGAPLLRVTRTTADTAGTVVEYADDLYVPGLTAITVENRLYGPRAGSPSSPTIG